MSDNFNEIKKRKPKRMFSAEEKKLIKYNVANKILNHGMLEVSDGIDDFIYTNPYGARLFGEYSPINMYNLFQNMEAT